MTALLRSSGLEIGHAHRALLPPIDLEIGAGEIWAIVGRNGSGKTTLLRTLLGLLPPVAGRVEPARADLRRSYVPQRTAYDELYPVRARDVVAMGVERGWSFARPRLREPREVARALVEMDAKDLAGLAFRSLSEGQKQRILLARLLASRAEVAFLDEPTAAMDTIAAREALASLRALRDKHGMAIVFVGHHLEQLRGFADRALLLDREAGALRAGPVDDVLDQLGARDA